MSDGSDAGAVRMMAEAYTAAWNSGSPDVVASFYTEDGQIVINCGQPWQGRAGVASMAAGFFTDVPDLLLTGDDVRCAGTHAVYAWTFTGRDAKTGSALRVSGWEEWELNAELKVQASRGWFDADDCARQVEGG